MGRAGETNGTSGERGRRPWRERRSLRKSSSPRKKGMWHEKRTRRDAVRGTSPETQPRQTEANPKRALLVANKMNETRTKELFYSRQNARVRQLNG